MEFSDPTDWPQTEEEARAIQAALAPRVAEAALTAPVHRIGGLDVAYDEVSDELVAALSLFRYPDMTFETCVAARGAIRFPYIPGLFSFRELPALLSVLCACPTDMLPDVIICDGHGRIHPRKFGLASHLGVVIDRPVIGCAKNHLCGEWEMPDAPRGSWSPVTLEGEVIGAALRTQTGVNPVFVSVGHKFTLEEAIETVLAASPSYRLPETTRAADAAVREAMANRP